MTLKGIGTSFDSRVGDAAELLSRRMTRRAAVRRVISWS